MAPRTRTRASKSSPKEADKKSDSTRAKKIVICPIKPPSLNRNGAESHSTKRKTRSQTNGVGKGPIAKKSSIQNRYSLKFIRTSTTEDEDESFACDSCNLSFETENMLAEHEAAEHESKPKCPTCKITFSRKSHLDRHLKTSCANATQVRFHCQECNKVFSRQDNLKQHMKKHSENESARDKKYQCETCSKFFYTPSHLEIHRRIHTGERPFKCDHCDKCFTNNGALKKHLRIHTGEKPFTCTQCELTFSLKGTLNRHMKIHTGVKPHRCEFCGKEFIQSGGLKAHLFFHTGKNGFKCNFCDRQFNRKARLDMHIKYVHEKVKPFNCESCDKSFTRKEDLNRHQVLHTGIKSHQCIYCKKKFAIKASLNNHLLTHRKEEPRACRQCGNAFIRKDCLIRHIRKVHRDQADVLLFQHGLIEKEDEIFIDRDLEGTDSEYQLVNGKLENEKLCEAIRELLLYVVDHKLLKGFGWPNKPVDLLLESLIKQCNYSPVSLEDYDYYDRLRENVKLLFTVVIEDDSLKETLNNKTVDELIVNVIMEAKEA